MKEIDLSGKKALVTGGGRGIGAEICRHLAACGADVFINYLSDQAQAQSLAGQISESHNVRVRIGQADVSEAAQVERLFEQIDAEFGGIDILVNNAGTESVDHALEMTEAEWDRVVNTNLKGPFLCSQQAGRRMENSGGGVIVNISSIHDIVPRKGLVHYCAAKAGLKMLSKCLSLELAEQNIRVVSISPGAIETDMNRDEIAELGRDKFEQWIPQARVGNVADVANAVVFLASDLAAYIEGADIYIDGGYMNNTLQYDPRPARKES